MTDFKALNNLRRSIARQYLVAVDDPKLDLTCDRTFVEALRLGLQCGELQQADLKLLFKGVSHTTVSRWVNGHHLPRGPYRPLVVKAVRDRVAATLQPACLENK